MKGGYQKMTENRPGFQASSQLQYRCVSSKVIGCFKPVDWFSLDWKLVIWNLFIFSKKNWYPISVPIRVLTDSKVRILISGCSVGFKRKKLGLVEDSACLLTPFFSFFLLHSLTKIFIVSLFLVINVLHCLFRFWFFFIIIILFTFLLLFFACPCCYALLFLVTMCYCHSLVFHCKALSFLVVMLYSYSLLLDAIAPHHHLLLLLFFVTMHYWCSHPCYVLFLLLLLLLCVAIIVPRDSVLMLFLSVVHCHCSPLLCVFLLLFFINMRYYYCSLPSCAIVSCRHVLLLSIFIGMCHYHSPSIFLICCCFLIPPCYVTIVPPRHPRGLAPSI